MIDNRTPNLNLPLPNENNLMRSEDVPRLRNAITSIDQALADRVTAPQLAAAIAALVGNAPAALNTLAELGDAINDDASFAATIMSALSQKLSAVPVATSVALGGFKVGSGLNITGDGVLSVNGAGIGTGLPAFLDVNMVPASDGQTLFTPAGGYSPGLVDVLLNGVMLMPVDFSATNGTTITLTVGANMVDIVKLRKWYYVPAEVAVNKTGDTMTGPLVVPANASGSQAPRVSEVIKKAGDTMTGALNGAPLITLAAAATVNIGAAASNLLSITGTTTVTAFDVTGNGTVRKVIFTGILTLTHNAATLILPGAANIITAAGDVAEFTSLGAGVWKCSSYIRQSGLPVIGSADATKLPLAGGNMTGPLNLFRDPVGAMEPVTKQYMEANGSNLGQIYAAVFAF